uniref:BCAS3 domain-containing protein n=1 Tax=Physcomitrium patens TaxID=3218 RepID=A0A7I4EFI3_PHYPA
MRNNADYHVRSPCGGKFRSFPSSFRTISNYLRSVSANASIIAASTVRQAAVSAASNGSLNEDDRQREQVQWSSFDKLELSSGDIRQILLLAYSNGFQVWDVQDASNVHELVSRRDGPVAFLRLQPKPILQDAIDGCANFKGTQPLLLVVTSDATGVGNAGTAGFVGGYGAGGGGNILSLRASHFVPTIIRFYSLRNHSYVHTLRFRTGIHAVRCSSRVVAVALAAQIYCFNAGTLQNIFTVLTYPSPTPTLGSNHYGHGAMAVGPRWLAYAAYQPLMATTGRVSPQQLIPSQGASPSTSPANGSLVAHYAKESSRHFVAGVMTLSDMGMKTISRYCSDLMPDGSYSPSGMGSSNCKNGINGHSPWQGGSSPEPEFAGTIIQDISFSGDSYWIAVSSSRGTNHLYAISPFGGVVGPQSHGTVPIDGLIGPSLTQAPVFPWWSNTGPLSLNQQALHPPPPALTLNVVGRIKNGNGGWRGTVTSAAVTATGRPNIPAGAVAAVFHDGGGAVVESGVGVGTLKDQLWVLCPTGHLLRYLLRPAIGGESGYTNGLPQMAGMSTTGSPGLAQELKVVVEPLERWDIARRPNWVEREERVEGLGAHHEEGVLANSGSVAISVGAVVKEGTTTEEMQRWFMSNAELQMYQARPVPIWAKSKIQFHVMLSGTPEESKVEDYPSEDGVGETEIERIPTRVVEVRKKDLVPLIERLQIYTKVQDSRDISVSDTLPGVSNAHEQIHGAEGPQDGFIGEGLKFMPIQRTDSCNSLGSEGAPFTAGAGGMNGHHQGYQDFSGVAVADTPSSFGSPPCFREAQQGLESLVMGRTELSHGPLLQSKDGTVIISGVEQTDSRVVSDYIKPGVCARFSDSDTGGNANHDHLDRSNVDGGQSEIMGGQLGQPIARLATTMTNAKSVAIIDRQSEDSISQENGGVYHIRSEALVNETSYCDLMPSGEVVANGCLPHDTSQTTSVLNPEFEAAFLMDLDRQHVVIDCPLNGRHMNGTADDADSEATEGAHSKNEDNEDAGQGDDIWEGHVFPFCEDS